jgi:hypothetical protein
LLHSSRGPLLALSWPNLPCALKAAIGYGKRTLGHPASLPRHRGRSKGLLRGPRPTHGPSSGVADSLDEAKAAFRAE